MKVEVNERDERLAGFTGLLLRLIVPALMPQSEQNLVPPPPSTLVCFSGPTSSRAWAPLAAAPRCAHARDPQGAC